MKTAMPNEDYIILEVDEDLNIVKGDDAFAGIDQPCDDELEVWKTRSDGFHFVYSNKIEVGYWVHPKLITIKD